MKVSAYENKQWLTLPESAFRDPLRVIPGKNNNYFISTWGMGLLEYSGTTLVNNYNQSNSPLNSTVPGQPFVRISGLAFDNDDNLWVTHSGVENNLKVIRPDRSWVTIPVTINAPTIGDIIITQTGKKWIVLPRGHGIFVYDDKNTLSTFNDDEYRKMTVIDTEGNTIPFVYCTTEDLEGNIWVGTDQGPVIYFNPERVFADDIKASRIKIPRNDGSGLADYLLNSEQITSIAIDGANRKWIGTQNSGAYLLSADGITTIRHYTKENSPLLSNTILSLSVDLSNGVVWFGTPDGVVSQRGDAPGGKDELKNVYSFPNPVRHDYNGVVTITGLARDTNVKITDISGNLVFETTSTGSEATWNLLNYIGERVATGVYLAFCATPGGTGSTVIKMLVIK
jgi:ligand-binding sensor domain-containing protein